MGVIQINKRVCDFHSEEEQKNFWDISNDLSPCERCGKDLCKYHRRSIKNEGWQLEKPSDDRAYSVVVHTLLVEDLCFNCLGAFGELLKDFVGKTPNIGYTTDF